MRSTTLASVVFWASGACFFAAAPALIAQEPGPGFGPAGMPQNFPAPPGGNGPDSGMAAGMPAPGDPFADLDLTATQREKLKELHRRDRARMQEAENALEDAREDLREVLDTPGRGKAFEDKAKAAHAKVVKLQAELEEQRFENVLAIRSVLNDEQLKKFSHHRPPRPFRPSEGAPDASKDTRSPGNSGEGGPSAPDAHPGTGD